MRATTASDPTVLHAEDDDYFASVLAERVYRNSEFAYAGLEVARGESDEQIAAALGITVEGVRTQKKRIMRLLDFHRFHQLVIWALELGFGGKPPHRRRHSRVVK